MGDLARREYDSVMDDPAMTIVVVLKEVRGWEGKLIGKRPLFFHATSRILCTSDPVVVGA